MSEFFMIWSRVSNLDHSKVEDKSLRAFPA